MIRRDVGLGIPGQCERSSFCCLPFRVRWFTITSANLRRRLVSIRAVRDVEEPAVVVATFLVLPQVESVYTDVLSPYPKEITQKEEQAVVYESSMFAPSPYKTSKQSTTIKLASSEVITPHAVHAAHAFDR